MSPRRFITVTQVPLWWAMLMRVVGEAWMCVAGVCGNYILLSLVVKLKLLSRIDS